MPVKWFDGIKVGYRKGKNPLKKGKPTLVMIHGAGANSEFWSSQLACLGNEMNAVALDLPGHGQSGGSSCDSIPGYAQWVYTVVDQWFTDPVYLMGHSMGGAIVQEVAIQHPHRFQGFILVGTGAMLKVTPLFLEGLSQDFEKTIDTIASYGYSKITDRQLVRDGARIMKKPGPAAVLNDFVACDRFDRRKAVENISSPCLIICGADDKLTPRDFSTFLQEKITGSRLKIIEKAGHMVMIEQPKAVNAAIQKFINEESR